jgi:hypothetical protein
MRSCIPGEIVEAIFMPKMLRCDKYLRQNEFMELSRTSASGPQ